MAGTITIQKTGITKLRTDAIVDAVSDGRRTGGGVCGLLFGETGYEKTAVAHQDMGGGNVGNAIITPGFELPARYILHIVSPGWCCGDRNEERLLCGVYQQSLILARQSGWHSIGFPLISSGIFGYPKDLAWRAAIQACRDFIAENPDYDIQIIFAVPERSVREMGEKMLMELSQLELPQSEG